MNDIKLASSLRTIASKLFHVLRGKMQDNNNLSLTEVITISNLYNYQPLSPTAMAAMVQVKTQTMNDVINRLDKLGFIVRTPSETDKRRVNISLTTSGSGKVETDRLVRDQWLTGVIRDKLNAAEKKILADAVAILNKLTDMSTNN